MFSPVLALEISLINNLHACTSFTRLSQLGAVQRKPGYAALAELLRQLCNPDSFPGSPSFQLIQDVQTFWSHLITEFMLYILNERS